MKKLLLVSCLFLLLCPGIMAQKKEKKKAQWKSKLTLGGSDYSGNVDKFDLRTEGNVTREDSILEFSSFFKATYGEVDSKKNTQEISGGIKFDYMPQHRLSPFLMFSACSMGIHH